MFKGIFLTLSSPFALALPVINDAVGVFSSQPYCLNMGRICLGNPPSTITTVPFGTCGRSCADAATMA